jgi:hypothetical protein
MRQTTDAARGAPSAIFDFALATFIGGWVNASFVAIPTRYSAGRARLNKSLNYLY